MELPWLKPLAERWRRQQDGRRPHAVMLQGAVGVGKRCAAAWLAGEALAPGQQAPAPRYPFSLPQHPDLHWLTPPADKHTIVVDQVRELVAALCLTSHDGGSKAAVIDPANAMTTNAANSLLKTLEEPPGDALIILVADRRGGLPATIFSRCQRLVVHPPAERDALAWLDRLRPGAQWAGALREAGGAPLAAVRALERIEETAAMAREFAAVAARSVSPIDIAARWSTLDAPRVLDWMCRQTQACIRRRAGGGSVAADGTLPDSVLQRMDSRNLFCYLEAINRLRGQAAGSFNFQLTLESLLIDWAEGLENYATGNAAQSLMFGAR